MPKNNKQGKGSKGKPSLAHVDKISRVSFHLMDPATALAAGVASIAVSPSGLGTRVVAISDAFALYRVVRLKYRLRRLTATLGGAQAVAYYPGVVDTVPNTTKLNSESLYVTSLCNQETVPSSWVELNREELAAYSVWLKTKSGSIDAGEEVQGYLLGTGSGTDLWCVEVEGEIEFKGPVDPSSTPEEKKAKYLREQKLKLLEVMSVDLKTGVSQTKGNRPAAD